EMRFESPKAEEAAGHDLPSPLTLQEQEGGAEIDEQAERRVLAAEDTREYGSERQERRIGSQRLALEARHYAGQDVRRAQQECGHDNGVEELRGRGREHCQRRRHSRYVRRIG